MNKVNRIYLFVGGTLLMAALLVLAVMYFTKTRKFTKGVKIAAGVGVVLGGLLSYKMLEVYDLNFKLFKSMAGYTGESEPVK